MPSHLFWELLLIILHILRHCFDVERALERRDVLPRVCLAASTVLNGVYFLLVVRLCLRYSPLVAIPLVLLYVCVCGDAWLHGRRWFREEEEEQWRLGIRVLYT